MNPPEEIAADVTAPQSVASPEMKADALLPAGVTGPADELALEADKPGRSPSGAMPRPVLVEVGASEVRLDPGSTAVRGRMFRAAAGGLLVLALAVGGWFLLQRFEAGPRLTVEPEPAAVTELSEPAASDRAQPAVSDRLPGWDARMAAADRLRAALRVKAEEVRRLQREYRFGVMEVEEEVAHLIKRNGIESLSQAMRHRQVELGLRSIQSRQAYAAGLEKPLRWLAAGGEELLFVKRMAEFDLEVLPFATGVDLDAHALRIDAVLQARQPTPEALAIDAHEPPPSLEAVWKRLADQARQLVLPATEQTDAAIAAEVCSGELARTAEVSVLWLKTARCLAASETKELFLNRVSDLPAAAAQKLSEWPGDWLGLNGLKRLLPEAARHLFAWPGRLISLNGLNELPADVSVYLPGWRGAQLELMGIRKVEAVEHLVQFEEAGGKLFLPPELRRQVDARQRPDRPPTAAEKVKR